MGLNLLNVFDLVMTERNARRAAERVALTELPSAMESRADPL
jgi:DNA-binding transcriptional LysR family regulator